MNGCFSFNDNALGRTCNCNGGCSCVKPCGCNNRPPQTPCQCSCNCPPGPQGPAGPQGPIGPVGPQGPVGETGATGPQGLIGPVGPQGPVGETGATGPQGPIGPVGPQGPVGETGATGPQGPIGPVGPQGPVGETGATGPQGPIGPVGPQGPVGETGATGPQGPIGPVGPQGPSGTAGLQAYTFYTSSPVALENNTTIPLESEVDQGGAFITETENVVELAAGDYEVIYALTASLDEGVDSFTVTPVINGSPQSAYGVSYSNTGGQISINTIGRAFIISSSGSTTLSFLFTQDGDTVNNENVFTATIKKIDSI